MTHSEIPRNGDGSENSDDYTSWLPKARAAHQIGVTTKTVEQLAKAGKLRQVLWRRPSGGALLAVYHPDDVERVALERPGRRTGAVIVDPASNGNGHGKSTAIKVLHAYPPAAPPADELGRWLITTAAQGVASQKTSQKLYLTLAEASAYSGLSEAYLRRQCQSGWPGALKDRGWKLRRTDVEAL